MSDRLERFWKLQLSATECAICLGVLSQPKFLSCLHTFCLSCLNQLHRASNNELLCPTCRASTAVPPEGVRGLRTNFVVDQMLEIRKLCDVMCHACANSSSVVATATAFCVDCGDNLCESCVSAHAKIRTLRSHRLVEIGGNDAEGGHEELFRSRPVHCTEHPNQEVALYCTDCSTSTCLSCCVLAHKGHSYVDIKEKAKESRKELERVLEAVSETMSGLREAGVELDQNLSTMNESATQTLNEIRKRADDFVVHVRLQENSLTETVEKFQNQFKKRIDKMLKDVETKIASIENFVPLCRQLMDSGTHCDVLRLSPQVCATANELGAANFTIVSLPSLVFTPPANGNLSEFNFLGKVAVIEEEGDDKAERTEECLPRYDDTWNMEDSNSKIDSSTENENVELGISVRGDNNDPATNLPSTFTTEPNIVDQFIPTSAPEKLGVSLARENHVDSNPSTILVGTKETVCKGYLPNVEVRCTFEAHTNYSSTSSDAFAEISDQSRDDQNEDDDITDNNSGHIQIKRRTGSLDDCNPANDDNANSRRPSDDRTNRSGGINANPSHVPPLLPSPAYGQPFEALQSRDKGSKDIETIPGVDAIVGLALLDQFIFVLRRNSNELELYDPNSLQFVCRETFKELVQPTDLTACARTHTLYIGHTRKIVFSVRVSQATLSLRKLFVAFAYTHLSTTSNCSVLMGCPKAEAILEYKEAPHWKLIRHIPMSGAYPTGMVQLSANRFAVSSKTNVLYIITEKGPNTTCEQVVVPHNMSHIAVDIGGTHLLIADCYGHQIRRLEPTCQGKARSSPILEAKTISKPCRLWTDTVGRRLFVGTTQGDIKVLRLA